MFEIVGKVFQCKRHPEYKAMKFSYCKPRCVDCIQLYHLRSAARELDRRIKSAEHYKLRIK